MHPVPKGMAHLSIQDKGSTSGEKDDSSSDTGHIHDNNANFTSTTHYEAWANLLTTDKIGPTTICFTCGGVEHASRTRGPDGKDITCAAIQLGKHPDKDLISKIKYPHVTNPMSKHSSKKVSFRKDDYKKKYNKLKAKLTTQDSDSNSKTTNDESTVASSQASESDSSTSESEEIANAAQMPKTMRPRSKRN